MTNSLIITTYNRPEALRLCLLSVLAQTAMPDEIIIADDGSAGDTLALVSETRKLSPVPLRHVWQEDKGFRAARSRNNAAAVAKGDYMIGIDGDLVLQRHFIADHLRFATPGHYLKGGRCNLGHDLTERLCREGVLPSLHPWTKGIHDKGANLWHCLPAAAWLATRYRRNHPGVLGCNQSFFRSDYMAVNGYDEQYEGWGGEDTDFIRRLRMHGIGKLHLKFAGGASHLWHGDNFMDNAEENLARSHRPDSELAIRCAHGVDRALRDAAAMDMDAPVIIFPG